MSDEIEVRTIAGMKPWACSYNGPDGRRYGITLYGMNAEEVAENNCADLDDLRVDGELVSIIAVDPKEEKELRRKFGGNS